MFSKAVKIFLLIFILVTGFFILNGVRPDGGETNDNMSNEQNTDNEKVVVDLAPPRTDSEVSLEQTLKRRRSVRDFTAEPLELSEVGQLLWSAQGISCPEREKRTAPSAGATYPLETYLLAHRVKGLEAGVYRYNPKEHILERVLTDPTEQKLSKAALGQEFIDRAPINFVFTAIYDRTTDRYGQRGERYVHMEAGHATQNAYLQGVSLGLGSVVVGAFDERTVTEILNIPEEEVPVYIMPIGHER